MLYCRIVPPMPFAYTQCYLHYNPIPIRICNFHRALICNQLQIQIMFNLHSMVSRRKKRRELFDQTEYNKMIYLNIHIGFERQNGNVLLIKCVNGYI